MNRMASMQVGAVLASLAMAFAGCSCDQPATCDNSDLTVAFVSPMEGAMVDQTSNVQVSLSRKGAPVNIGTAKLEVRGPGATDFTDKGNGTADGATATFTGVMLAAGENALRATVAEANCNGSAAPKTIVVTAKSTVTPPPVIVSCTFPQDVNGDGTLNAAELPMGTQVSVRVLTTNGAGATFSAPGSNPAMAPIVNDTATIGVPGPTGDGTFSVTGTVTRGTGAPTCSPMIRVARTPPMCMNTTASLVGPNNDANPMSPGFQLALLGTVSTAVDSARFEVEPGSLSATAMIANGMAGGILTIPTTGDVTYSTTLIAVDAVGNECRSQKDVRANFAGPRLTVTSPVNPDGGAVDFAQTPQSITIVSVGLENGRQICVDAQVGAGAPAQVGCGTVSNNSSTFDLNLTADGVTTFTARATDSVGNAGSTTFVANVALEGCVPAFNPALGCPNAYLTSADVTGGQFAFTGSARASCATRPARLFIGTSTTAAATAVVGATGALSFASVAVSAGTFDARIEVDRQGGGTPYSVTCAGIVVDLTAPAITNPAPPTTPPFVINSQQDLQPAVAGAQRSIAFSGTIPPSGTAHVCMSQSAGSSGTACPGNTGFFLMNPAAGVGTSPVAGFTFPEGEYQIRLILRRGNGINSSASVPLRVDVTAPCVSVNGFTFPQDTVPTGGDGRLNIAELAAANPRVSVTLDAACADPAAAPATTLTIRELNGGTLGATRASGAASAGATSLTFTAPVIATTNLTLFAEAVDWVGNRNNPSGSNNPAVKALGIYPVAPSCSITSPTAAARLNAGAVSGGIFAQAQSSTGGVVGTNGVEFSLTRGSGSPVVQTATPAGTGLASTTYTTQDGAYSLAATCTDLALNVQTTAPVSFLVDATPPTGCAVSTPVGGQTTITNQIATTVSTTSTETNATVRVASNLPAADTTVGTFSLNGTSATSTLTYVLGNQNLTVTITDDFSNSCSVSVANVNVTSTTCVFTVSRGFVNGPTWLNKSAQADTSITVNTTNCRGQAATLVRASPSATFNATTNATTGDATFAVTPVDGDSYTITVGNSTPTTVVVDFVDPVVPAGAFTVAGAAPTVGDLKFVAAAGNPRVAGGPLATAGYYADLNPGTNGAQIALAINGITGARQAGNNGRVEILVNGASLPNGSNSSDVIDADPKSVTFNASPVNFPHPQRTAVPLVARVFDQAGNGLNAFSGTLRVDVVAPTNPARVLGTVTRGGSVPLTWNQTFDDDGDTNSGAATVEIRWTTDAVTNSGSLANEPDYFAATTFKEPTDLPGTTTSTTVRVPPNTIFFVGVRAKDSLENYSTFVVPAAYNNKLQEVSIVDPNVTSTSFGQALGTADVTGDGIKDILVGAPGPAAASVGNVIVLRGRAGLASAAPCTSSGPDCAVIAPFDSAAGRFGLDLSTGGNVGEPGEDFVVGQPSFAGGGRAIVYFGVTDGGMPATAASGLVEIRGDAQSTGTGTVVKILRDVDGDGLDEVAVVSSGWDATNASTTLQGVGRVYIFRGRTFAQWQALGAPVSVNAATWIVNGPSPKLTAGTTSNGFGQGRFGFISVGKPVGSPGGNDFLIPMSRLVINQVQFWSAGTVSPAAMPLANTSRTQALTEPVGTTTALTGFGFTAVSGLNIIASSNATQNDLVVGYPNASRIQVWTDITRAGISGNATNITGPNGFGGTVAAASLSDDASVDLVVNENGNTPQAVWLLFQTSTGFANVPASTTDPLNFWAVPYRTGGANSRLGSSLATDDVTGDGQVDVIAADSLVGAVRILR